MTEINKTLREYLEAWQVWCKAEREGKSDHEKREALYHWQKAQSDLLKIDPNSVPVE